MGVVADFPPEWRVDVTLIRRPGRDARGNPGKDVGRRPLDGCLIGQRTTSDSGEQSALTSTAVSLYRDPEPGFTFEEADQFEVPQGHRMAGLWSVDGRPAEWPMGVEVPLRRA